MTSPQDSNRPEHGFGGMPPLPDLPGGNRPLPKAPTEVTVSYWIWVVGAVLVALNAVVTLVIYRERTLSVLVGAFRENKNSGITEAQFRDTASTALLIVLVIFLLLVGLALFLANRMHRGRNGSRVGLTVIAVLVVLLVLLGGGGTSALITVLVPIVGTVLMYLPKSNAFFSAST